MAALVVGLAPAPAAADWYFTPFIGYDFNGTTTFFADLQYRFEPRRKVTFGGAAALTRGVLGLEVEYAFVPRYFQRDDPAVFVVGSHVQTATGNVLLLAPLSLTQESLRPYVAAGVGWMGAHAALFRAPAFDLNESLVAFNVGGGAIGMFGRRTGLRFDLRYFTNLDRDIPGSAIGSARVKFWRGTVGFILRH